ncbi:contractile injection system protein, VgrG/Pvc8 family [Sorangium sp. So ce513]|uniref:contractile injection system protein, VgrG/Pvc8 family n=1 Tax=Sorangium sp. So ce513 TaxID=3133315 RepID=UPI003F5EF862
MECTLGQILLAGGGLPSDVTVHSYEAHEAISLPYVVGVEISTSDPYFRVDACLQRRMRLEVDDGYGGVRYYDGLPDRVGFVAYRGGEYVFHLRLRPAFAALEHREGSRIFQDMSPVDVVKTILADAGVDSGVELQIRASEQRRAVVQRCHCAPSGECAKMPFGTAMRRREGTPPPFPQCRRNAGLLVS